MKESVDPPRGRMLRGKSVIETSDYNQPFSGLQRGAGGSNFSTSAFQPPQQLYNQQLQQQLLLQKAGLLGTGFQHGRSTSHVRFNVCLYQFVIGNFVHSLMHLSFCVISLRKVNIYVFCMYVNLLKLFYFDLLFVFDPSKPQVIERK